jgi:hypothetical protein
VPRGVKVRIFIRDENSGELISEVVSSHKETQPFEAFRMFSPLPFARVNFKGTLAENQEMVIAFLPAKDLEWAQNLMNFPAWEKSDHYQYEPVMR